MDVDTSAAEGQMLDRRTRGQLTVKDDLRTTDIRKVDAMAVDRAGHLWFFYLRSYNLAGSCLKIF